MELVYLWVEDYKNIEKNGFNFSPRFKCEFKYEYDENNKLKDNCELIIDYNKEYINIFPDNLNITAIVGENGSGKSSILDLLLNRYLNKNKLFFIYYQNNKLHFSGVSNRRSIDVKDSVTLNISINDFLNIVDDTKIVYYSNILNEADHVLPSVVKGHYLAKSINISTSYILDQNKTIETEFNVVNVRPKTGFDKIYRSYRIQQIQMALLAIKNTSEESFNPPFNIPDKIIIKNVNLKNLFIKFKEDFKENFEKKAFKELLDILEKSNSSEEIFSNYVKMNLILSLILENKDSPNLKKLLRDIINVKTLTSLEYFYENAKRELTNPHYLMNYSEFFDKADKLLREIEKFPKKISNGYEIELSIKDNEFDFLEIYERLIQQSEYFWDFNWRGLSSGEEVFLYQFSRFYFLRKNFKEDENLNLKIKRKEVKNLIWLIDEGEGNLHPEWQKRYINYLIEFFSKNFTQNIHIILTSHSPFIISDLPKENVIFLEKGEQLNPFEDGKQTFGANIHTLLSHGFFMKEGLMGEFAKDKINQVYNFISRKDTIFIKTKEEAQNIINLIGEPMLKKELQFLYDKEFEIDDIDKQIREHEEAIEKLKSKKKKMIKIDIDETIVNNFYNGVKEYIGQHLFILNPEKDYFTDEKIEEIIKCKIDDFQKIIDEINSLGLNQDLIKKAFVGDENDKFGYKKFTTKAKTKYRAYNLSEALNIDVCPYCNKNYTYTIVNKTHQFTRPDFDHFLAKEKYPYFAMSFYNLVPSCQVCNRTLKLRKEFFLTTHLHPYKDDFNSIKKFTTNKPLLLCNNEKDFEIEFKDESKNKLLLEKANKNIEDFALPLQYNKHKDIILELKNRYDLYNDDSIKNILKDTEVFKKKGEEYIKSLVMCSSTKDKDINKRPLSKLIKDISEELDLI